MNKICILAVADMKYLHSFDWDTPWIGHMEQIGHEGITLIH